MAHRTEAMVARADREKESADLLDLLIEQVVDYAIFVLDADGRIASWNPGACRIKGYTAQEIIGQPYAVFFTEEDRVDGRPGRILDRARQHGRFQDEGWRVRKDGTRFWASAVVTALRGPDGTLRGFAKITRDLSEHRAREEAARHEAEERAARRQAELDEREVRRSRDQLDLILKTISEGVVAREPDGRVIFANDAIAHICGLPSAEAFRTTPPGEIINAFEMTREDGTPFPPDELPAQRALKGTPASAFVVYKSKRTGEARTALVSAAPVLDARGAVELTVSVARDVTERRRAEEAWQYLAESSFALGASLDYQVTLTQIAELAVPRIADWCGIDILEDDGRLAQLAVAHVDPSKRELARELRRRWPPLPGSPAYAVVRSGEAQIFSEISDEMIDAGTPDLEQRRITYALGLRSAMLVPLNIGKKPFGVISFVTAESGRRYGDQDLVLAVEVARRASLAIENARAFSEARDAVQTRDNFLAIASHELKTPLSGLTMLLTSLLRLGSQGRLAALGPEGLQERLKKADRQARQLTRLIERLLDVSRLSTRDLQLERERVDLGEVARDVISRFEDEAAAKGIHIELLTTGPVVGWWDRSRIDQVITNLVGNAVKFGSGKPVTVSIAHGGANNVRLTVRDQGPGIAPEDQERIFGQFERAAGTEDLPGMGLGLWLVRRIVAGHGGALSVDSAPGQGATFVVVLPLGQPEGAATQNLLPRRNWPEGVP